MAVVLRTPLRELLLTGWTLILFGAAEISVRTRPIRWSARRFGVRLVDDPDGQVSGDVPLVLDAADHRALRAVQRLSPRLYGSRRGCLRRSLVLGHLLRHHRPVMRIGVRRDADGFAAHAWLEINGNSIETPGDYVAFDFAEADFS